MSSSSSLPRLESSFDWIQGRRWEMEDSHIVADNAFDFWEEIAGEEEEKLKAREKEKEILKGKGGGGTMERVSLYCVFDGHGGNLAADLAEEIYAPLLLTHEGFIEGKMQEAMTGAFAAVDKRILDLDEKKARQSGATALCAALIDRKLYVANLGDSEGILCKTAGKTRVIELTFPHKATNKDEVKRITDAGGRVMQKRVCGSLAVTRGLGDYDFKIPYVPKGHDDYVSRIPYFSELEIDQECDFMVLACDGLWDVVSHKRAAEIVDKIKRKGRSATDACEALITESLDRETTDNVSIVVVYFQWG